ncbi:hypothetical protein [Sphingopyxis terrae]|uniref:hypothetical protein n=1 Tax=Sphingopyxis terrae TaxID=33052 RepID=UPI0013C4D8FF|nr:hypothetical protein [Sphingopyxis terrae]
MPFKNPDPIYNVWQGIKRRCLNPRAKQFDDYGGRGIEICERWLHSFANFKADMGPRPPGHSIDRIDNDKGYFPDNCRWATRCEQQRNRRQTRIAVIGGVSYIASELSERSGLKTDTIMSRAALGLSLDEVISPKRRATGRGWTKGVIASRAKQLAKTHCAHGHEWTPENTRITPEGWRNCRTCHREKMRKRTAAGL